jgi:hypothetical protein
MRRSNPLGLGLPKSEARTTVSTRFASASLHLPLRSVMSPGMCSVVMQHPVRVRLVVAMSRSKATAAVYSADSLFRPQTAVQPHISVR